MTPHRAPAAPRLARLCLALLCALAAALLLSSLSAEAATPPTVDDQWVTEVAATSATLKALVNPQGSDTTYYFQYGTASCVANPSSCADLPAPPGADIGSGTSDLTVGAHPQDLLAGTTYHFRVAAASSAGPPLYGPDMTFTTQTPGGALRLPDGRQWELVSPPDKHQGVLESPGFMPNQASDDGAAIAYLANGPIVADPPGNEFSTTSVLSTRGPAGWSTQDISPPHDTVSGYQFGGPEYRLFSSDLSLGVVEPWGETALPPLAESAERTFYERHADGAYEAIVTSANVTSGEKFANKLHFWNASPDLAHVVLESTVPLTGTAIPGEGLYEWSPARPPSEQLQLLSLLPGGTAAGCPELGGRHTTHVLRRAISSDGSRVVWSRQAGTCGGGLYLRDTVRGETLPIAAGEATFQIASADGSRVFFTPTESTGELYVCEVIEEAGKLKCRLPLPDLAPGVQGNVLGSSEDGSYVYFVAGNVLTAARYNGAGWESRPVAALGGGDENDWSIWPYRQTARVSPDGRYVAFMSERPLTGYDNRDARSGARDEEVFLYDWRSNRLLCASCDPTGARPAGVEDSPEANGGTGPLVDHYGVWSHRWLAGLIPGWTSPGLAPSLYQPRYLSDNGRLFFDSPDALVPQDANGTWDVYQYEPAGLGGCTPSSPTYGPASGGCVGLISSGGSKEESAFVDASAAGGRDAEGHEGGGDVFFQTTARLLPQDYDAAFDLYDAHECSAAAPCFPPASVSPPPCSTTDSCRAAPQPQPPLFGAPPSATFSGPGNVHESAPGLRCAKGKVKRRGKCVAKKPHKHHRRAHKRANRNRGGGR